MAADYAAAEERAAFAESLLCALAFDHARGNLAMDVYRCCSPGPMGCVICEAQR